MSEEAIKVRESINAFYAKHGPCCAGCDWWRWLNSVVGECIESTPVAGVDRMAMLGISSPSLAIGAGHVMTGRDHYCGKFHDSAITNGAGGVKP